MELNRRDGCFRQNQVMNSLVQAYVVHLMLEPINTFSVSSLAKTTCLETDSSCYPVLFYVFWNIKNNWSPSKHNTNNQSRQFKRIMLPSHDNIHGRG